MIVPVIASLFFCQVLGSPIVGGQLSDIQTYSWIASIQIGGFHNCGGSIISRTLVLTAAHCVIHPPRSYIVRVGSARTDSGGSWHNVVAIKRYERFDVKFHAINDVALIKVSPPIELDGFRNKIKLAEVDYVATAGTNVSVVGWGSMAAGGPITLELRSTSLHIVDRDECARDYGDDTGTVVRLNHQLCAYGWGRDACSGDSGGPLVTAQDIQIGIIAGGLGCADPRYPGIYQDVAYYRDWIDENSKKL